MGFVNEKEVIDAFKKRLPKAYQWAMAKTLTDAARGAKKEFPSAVDSELTLRSRSFANKSSRYIRASGYVPIKDQKAYFGTVAIERSTGWIETATGGRDKRKRKWTKKARRSGKGSVLQKYRFKPSLHVLNVHDFPRSNMGLLFRFVYKNKWLDRPIIIGKPYKGSKLLQGVIRFSKRKVDIADHRYNGVHRKKHLLVKLADYDDYNVKKAKLLEVTWRKYRQKMEFERMWKENFKDQIKRIAI